MTTDLHRAALITETDALAELLREADPATPIPTCPGWTLADLATHVGRAQRWAAAMITDRSTEEFDIRAVPDGARPADPQAAARWLSEGARLALAAVDSTGPDAEIWTTLGTPRPVHWWIRRLAHEAVAHHADALLALGRPVSIEPAVAADAISEWLDLLSVGLTRRAETVLAADTTLHLHATDPELGPDGEWIIRPSGRSITWEHAHAKATVAVRARAFILLLVLLGRIRSDDPGVEIHGDPGILTWWLERTPF
ncbi:maleylpyruvate isomerase family mycothiol-dependent enzyme [Nocardia exalbida]|uniref:maleylpyruvate isomerase family mycothiol-dependent enzyme n=1 Tax=Nocardia exalbida TaxID=290231 RepID=UPI0002ED022E|nr:maleylpyruvate isomerase family mycothiol-dependent enzyme [Nocardia exalbida]